MEKKAIILSVAGSDCSGGAGIQADIKTISALGGYAAAAITGVTVQNTLGVSDVHLIPAEIVGKQMEAVLEDLHPDVVKIGMTGNAEIVREIARVLRRFTPLTVVFDPVMVATSGRKLMTEDAIEAVRTELFSVVSLVTPNLQEAGLFVQRTLSTVDEMKEAARLLFQTYRCAFLIKGGHLEGTDMCDVLYDGSGFHLYCSQRVESGNLHGTGCTLSSAIATYLAQGDALPLAIEKAKKYISRAIEAGKELHIGHGNGPLWHLLS